jgi:O-antigen/teichoic acid export membrane protein
LLAAVLGSYVIEGLVAAFLYARTFEAWLVPRHHSDECRRLLREGAPLAGAVLFDSLLARADWILLGALRTQAEVAEYAFAYRVFEICWLPFTAAASVALPVLSTTFARTAQGDLAEHRASTTALLRSMLVVATLPGIALALGWVPIVEWATAGKYGSASAAAITFLAVGTPFVGGTAALWSIGVALRRTARIPIVMAAVVACNIILDLWLVPIMGITGAALGMLAASATQFALYGIVFREVLIFSGVVRTAVSVSISTAVATAIAYHAHSHFAGVMFAVAAYGALMALGRNLYTSDFAKAASVLSRAPGYGSMTPRADR